MTFTETNYLSELRTEIEHAIEYIVQGNAEVSLEEPEIEWKRLSTTQVKIRGEFVAGEDPGDIYLTATLSKGDCRVNSVFISFGTTEDYKECPWSTTTDFLAALTTAYNRYIGDRCNNLRRINAIEILCDRILALENSDAYRTRVEELVNEIKAQI